jgi:hypothetical protein
MNKKQFIKNLSRVDIIQVPLMDTIKEYNLNIDKTYSKFKWFQSLKKEISTSEWISTWMDEKYISEELENWKYVKSVFSYGGLHIYNTPNSKIDKKVCNHQLQLGNCEYWDSDLEFLEMILLLDWGLFECLNFNWEELKNK